MASVKKVKEGGIFHYFKDTEEYWVCQINDAELNPLKGTANCKELDPAI